MSHGEMAGSTNLVYHPEKHIEVIVASSNNQIIGRALFCLAGHTVIATVDGDKRLDELVDKQINVLSFDGKTTVSNTCTVKPTALSSEKYQIELEDGTIIECTGNHRFLLTDGTYKAAEDLLETDELAENNDTSLSYFEYIDSIIAKRGQ